MSNSSISTGLGGLPKVRLAALDGAQAEIYLHGSHVTSWIPAGGAERLFLSPISEFKPGVAIRGGVPVLFPQFGGLGSGPRHGFARTLPWELTSLGGDAGSASVELTLIDDDSTRQTWPHPFQVKLKVSVAGAKLSLSLAVMNTGDETYSFTGALHTYLRVEDVRQTHIEGLQGIEYYDTVNHPDRAGWEKKTQVEPRVGFDGEVDRVYCRVPGPLRVDDTHKVTSVTASGFPDTVVWNPGPERAARLNDLGAENYLHFVCVEAAVVDQPVTLGPSQKWEGKQELLVI